MKRTIIILLVLICGSSSCLQTREKADKDSSLPKPKVFEFENDSINQIIEIFFISDDTLKVNLKTINRRSNASCILKGYAIHDTVGDYLLEEETREIEGNEVISVKYFTFVDDKTSLQLLISLDISTKDKLVFDGPLAGLDTGTNHYLLNSIGTLRHKK